MAKKDEFSENACCGGENCSCGEGGQCADSAQNPGGECGCSQPSEIEALKAALAKAQEEARKNYDSFLRSAADLDTFRRRIQRDMEDMRKFSIQPFVEELLPSIDNLELGLNHAKKDKNFKELVVGIEMVLGQIKKVFSNFGIVEISPLGGDFDPNFHECVAHEPSDKYAENKVSSIMRAGYTLNGRLIRPASVVVSCGSKKE